MIVYEWKDISGYEGLYKINIVGDIISLSKPKITNGGNYFTKEIVLKKRIVGNGYIGYTLWKEGKHKQYRAHRLVAETFISNPEGKPQINHRDGNKSNNGFNEDGQHNLERCNNSENQKHAYKELGKIKTRFWKNKKGLNNPLSKWIMQYNYKYIPIKLWCGQSDIQRKTNGKFKCSTISQACCGRIKSAYGYFRKIVDANKILNNHKKLFDIELKKRRSP